MLEARTAHEAKEVGKRLNKHAHPSWHAVKSLVMDVVLFQKFSQAKDRCQLLLETEDRPLWECTKDKCWGVGFSEEEAHTAWWTCFVARRGLPGQNLHGLSLMHVREILRGQSIRPNWVIGDSITANTASEGLSIVTLSGALQSRVLFVCSLVLQLPGVNSLIVHVGMNDISPRLTDRSDLRKTMTSRQRTRLQQKGRDGERQAWFLRKQICKLASDHQTCFFYISSALPRPCEWVGTQILSICLWHWGYFSCIIQK